MPLDHIGINVPDVASAQEYYDALMPLVGFQPFMSGEDWLSYAPVSGEGTQLFFYAAQADGAYSRDRPGLQHLGSWSGPSRGTCGVRVGATARRRGAGRTPGIPAVPPAPLAAYWVDPHGFKIEVVSFAVE